MKCTHPKCVFEATCVPKFMIPATGFEIKMHTPFGMVMDCPMCDMHFREVTAKKALLIDANLRMIIRAMTAEKKIEPDFERMWVDPLKLHDPEYLTSKGMMEDHGTNPTRH